MGLIFNLLKPRCAPALCSPPEAEPQRQMAPSAAPPEATRHPKSLKQSPRSPPSPVAGPIREVLRPISFQEDEPSPRASPDSERGTPGEKNVGSALEPRMDAWGGGARRGLAVPRARKTLTDILVEGIGGKERHVRCAPRCPRGLPLDTAGVKVRRRKEAPQVQKQRRRQPTQDPPQPLLSPTPGKRGGGGGGGHSGEAAQAPARAGRVGKRGDLSTACSESDENPALPPRCTRRDPFPASSVDLPRVGGIRGCVFGFSIARESREDEVLQARRGRLSTSGVIQTLGKKEASVWVQPSPSF